jgi:hypothetical protein
MLLSELLNARVVDVDGKDLGLVEDVRLVQDGPLLLPFGAALRVTGVIVGRGALGIRLGYYRGGVQGPWLLRMIFERLERRARYVNWDDVANWDGDTVRLTRRADDLGPIPK